MNARNAIAVLALTVILGAPLHGAPEAIDLPGLAKKCRPSVLLLSVLDANNNEIATGTGFIISPDGRVVTNHHVIENAASVVAKGENGAYYKVDGILADDADNDIAILKLDASDLPALQLGDSTKAEEGQQVAVIGSPLGLEGTLSEGIISGNREADGRRILQISAPISPGSSGSPVLDTRGDVIGVASATLTNGQELNLAVPIEAVKSLLPPQNAKPFGFSSPSPTPEPQDDPDTACIDDPDYQAETTAQRKGDYTEALRLANELVGRYPGSEEALTRQAFALGALDLDSDAIVALKAAIKLSPKDGGAWEFLACEYNSTKQWAGALDAAKNAIKLNPDDGLAWAHLGRAQLGLQDFQNAENSLDQALKIKPDSRQAWSDLIECYRKQKSWAMVSVLKQRAASTDVMVFSPSAIFPGYANTEEGQEDVWNDPDYKAAQSAFLANDTPRSIKLYSKVLTRFPDSIDALLMLGLEYRNQHDLAHSLALWKQAARRLPDNQTVQAELAAAYLDMGLNDDAIECFRRLTSPDYSDWGSVAVAFINTNNYDAAAVAIENSIKMNPKAAFPWWLRGCDLYIQRHYSEAIAALNQSITLNPNAPQPWRELAKVYSSLGRKTDAANANRKAKAIESITGLSSGGDSLAEAAANFPLDPVPQSTPLPKQEGH